MIKEDVRMKKWAPRVLLAAALAGLSAFLLKGDGIAYSPMLCKQAREGYQPVGM